MHYLRGVASRRRGCRLFVSCCCILLIASTAWAEEKTYVCPGHKVIDSVFTRARNADDAKEALEALCAAKFSATVLKEKFDEQICKPAPKNCTFVESTDVTECTDEDGNKTASTLENFKYVSAQRAYTGYCVQCVTGVCHYNCTTPASTGRTATEALELELLLEAGIE